MGIKEANLCPIMDILILNRKILLFFTSTVVASFLLFERLDYIGAIGAIFVLSIVFVSLRHAFKRDRFKWFVMMLLFWPLAFVYAFLVDTTYVDE